MSRLFISQERLDEWVEQDRVKLEDGWMTLQDGKRFRLVQGVFFVEVVGGDPDPHELVGLVKTKAQLAQMDAEHYPGSVIIGDVGYEVREGFVGEPNVR